MKCILHEHALNCRQWDGSVEDALGFGGFFSWFGAIFPHGYIEIKNDILYVFESHRARFSHKLQKDDYMIIRKDGSIALYSADSFRKYYHTIPDGPDIPIGFI